jgi:hypothetical protein
MLTGRRLNSRPRMNSECMIKKYLPGKRDVLNHSDLRWIVKKAVILVHLRLAVFVIKPVTDSFFDDCQSAYERIISPLWRGDSGVCYSDGRTHPTLRAPLSRGEAVPC